MYTNRIFSKQLVLSLLFLLFSMQSVSSINIWQKLLSGSMSTVHWAAITAPTMVGCAAIYSGWANSMSLPNV